MIACPACGKPTETAPRCTLCGLPVHAPYYAIGQPVCDRCVQELAAQRARRQESGTNAEV